MTSDRGFIGRERLLEGPWQAFERDVARLLLNLGYEDVRLVGGSGDKGADVLAVAEGKLWVFQCKHSRFGMPPASAVDEVVRAAEYYRADRCAVALSRPVTDAIVESVARHARTGVDVQVVDSPRILRLLEAAPEYARSRRTLRPYQERASNRLREGLLDTGRAQIVMATGLGKSLVMAETVADLARDGLLPNGRVLCVAHVKEIVRQLNRAFWHQLPKWMSTHELMEGEYPTYWEGITFATIQSLDARIEELPQFDLVLIDEAHHVGAATFQRVVDALNPPMLGGVTATPWRGDDYDIDLMLGPALDQLGIADGLTNGFLTEVDYRLMADDIDWTVVQHASEHGYSLKQLNTRLIIPTRDDEAARIIRLVFDETQRHSGIVFSPSVEHAEHFAAVLRSFGLKAEAISSRQEPRERERTMAVFRAGQLDIVASVDLFNEGVDVPDVDLIVFMRVTHSRRIFVQQLGRGLRTAPGKTEVVVLDFVTDLRRLAEVIELDSTIRAGDVEHLNRSLGARLVQFEDKAAGDFMREWMLDQASLIAREGESSLELPWLDFPEPPAPGGIE